MEIGVWIRSLDKELGVGSWEFGVRSLKKEVWRKK
jgi:hypothetical protein